MTVIAVIHVDIKMEFVWVIVLQDGTVLAVATSAHLVARIVHHTTTYLAEHVSPIPTGTLPTDASVTTVGPDTTVPILVLATLPYTHQSMIVIIVIPYALEGVQAQLAATAIAVPLTLHWTCTDLVFATLTGVVMIVALIATWDIPALVDFAVAPALGLTKVTATLASSTHIWITWAIVIAITTGQVMTVQPTLDHVIQDVTHTVDAVDPI